MKNSFVRRLYLLSMVFLFVACKKEVDQPFVEEELGIAKGKAPAPCKILSITSNQGFGATDLHWVFTYNSNGDPATVITDQEGTGNPNLYFRYDANNRLTDIIGLYGVEPTANGYEFWQVLQFDTDEKVIGSTFYIWGEYGDEPDPNSFDIYSVSYTYDDEGRIVGSYPYDSKGNQILGGKKNRYDNRNNIRLTNPVWSFFDLNYSVNNPEGSLKYNRSKYPIQFNTPSNFLGKYFETATIVYDCP